MRHITLLSVLASCGGEAAVASTDAAPTTFADVEAGSLDAGAGSGSSGSFGGSGGSSGGTTAPPCPTAEPSAGDSCTIVDPQALAGVVCEYGNDPNPACNALFTCQTAGWVKVSPGSLPWSEGNGCVMGQCPSYAQASQNAACTSVGLECAYGEAQCTCRGTYYTDAGVSPSWVCFSQAGCPEPRPRLGTPCSGNGSGDPCNYSSGGCPMFGCNPSIGYWVEVCGL